MKLEELIAKHRPPRAHEGDPCGSGQLWHLNKHRLLMKAVEVEREKMLAKARAANEPTPDFTEVVISKLTAWEVLAEAQRAGLRLAPMRPDPVSPPGQRQPRADDDEHGAFLPES